jgi:NOL1/NOP2/sun family putative RNA methylase
LFYIQEPSAMCPVEVLAPVAGEFVLDLCAAPGGKSVQIAGHLQGEGLLVSNDSSATRCKALVHNLERAGVTNAVVLTEQPYRLADKFPDFFDAVLVDAPCSGEGMFRRDESAAAAWGKRKPDACAATQREILRHAANMLKPGGRLVYSTCTFNTTENEEVILNFLTENPNFKAIPIPHERLGISHGLYGLHEAGRIWPHKHKGEGHFVCLLKKEEQDRGASRPTPRQGISSSCSPLCGDGASHRRYLPGTLNPNCAYAQFNHRGKGDVSPFGGSGGSAPAVFSGLRVAMSGWRKYRGDKPSQAYAMGVVPGDVEFSVNLSEGDAWRYLRGESLFSEMDAAGKPWVLVCWDGFPLGWARLVQGRLKNQLPPHWIAKG